MITLDETIEQERKQAEMYKCEYECECDYYGKAFVDDHADEFECIKKIHEHEQLAEWLEELKMYKEVGTVEGYKSAIECYNEEYTIRKSNKQYNKAIDDFIEKVELKYLGVHPDELYEKYYPSEICKQIKELAEELKESGVK